MKNKGFTLLETIIYLALFSVLMSGALVAVYTLLQSGTQNLNAISIQAEGTFISRKLSWALSGATTVVVPNASTIIITRPELGSQSPLTITEDAGTFSIAQGTGTPVPFTNSFLTVAHTNIALTPEHAGVPSFIQMRYTINDAPFVFETYLKQ
jgi:prepilin-type N-terminal cleavage/methylation domain-containing protein